MSPLQTYQEMSSEIGLGRQGTTHLLLGNGFSISCDRRFSYDNLYEAASENYSQRLKALFELEGHNNFEGVLKILDDSIAVGAIYGNLDFVDALGHDKDAVRGSLVTTLVETHMTTTAELSEDYKTSCGNFLRPYFNVFTTNYDLLLYWVEMHNPGLQGNDGFREADDVENADYVVFKERAGGMKSIFFLHGALHLYRSNGQLRKHTWCRTGTPLIPGIESGFARKQYPLFVAEGCADKKLQQIRSDPYLDYCLGKLGRIQGNLVTYGISFGDNDSHILNVIRDNRKLRRVYVGLFGGENTPENIRIIRVLNAVSTERNAGEHPLNVKFYSSETAHVWQPPE